MKNEIDKILSREEILVYLSDIRTKVLWPDEDKPFVPIKNVKRRAFYACVNKIPCKISSNDVFLSFSTCRSFRLASNFDRSRKRQSNHWKCTSMSQLSRIESVRRLFFVLFSIEFRKFRF